MTEQTITAEISVLVIDDEPPIQRLMRTILEDHQYQVTAAAKGQEGLTMIAQRRFDLILLDIGLPDLSGIAVLKQIREWSEVPVVVLTVQNTEREKIEALDAGADDYITKPFDSGEMLARLRAAVRRANRSRMDVPVLRFGNIAINLAARLVTRDGKPVKLSGTEYMLLKVFVQHAGKVLTHRQILREVWGPDNEKETQYVRIYVQRLREKLEANPDAPVYLLTETGIGYRLFLPENTVSGAS